ncbi:DUF3325 domain-containing protein [Alloalcanivorax sp. C16-2]|uniref:DUF3325 family protein n=1 Tax=Alloalcanivorax TaxID=3020832 RepID=UPI0019335A3B|nr:DUF3325 domain-containing protein [Alloalcanivorax marinus]
MTLLPLTWTLGYAGLTALALAMKRHHEAMLGSKASEARLRGFRVLGWALLATMTAGCLMVWPTGLALWMAFGMVAFAGLPLVFLLPYRPRLAARLALGLPVIAAVFGLMPG